MNDEQSDADSKPTTTTKTEEERSQQQIKDEASGANTIMSTAILNGIKKKILNPQEYKEICEFLLNYPGLTIECELEMILKRFAAIDRLTLKSIAQTELGQRTRSQHWRHEALGKKHLKRFERMSADNWHNKLLVNFAIEEHMPPVALCRAILQEKYQFTNKAHITRLLKYPNLIDDPKLAANVVQCLCCDSQEGPLVDLRRRVLGEEYEFKLKQLANTAGMHFYDENDLRRLGYDKTPDIKLILPFLYKNEIVNWIESKACFGDPKTHKYYIQQQLNSYTNRFGPGIVIYWFGYRTDTPHLPENSVGIIVLEDFPNAADIEFLNLNTNELDDMSMSEIWENTSLTTNLDTSQAVTTAAVNTPASSVATVVDATAILNTTL